MRISDWISDVCASDLYAFNKSHSFGYGYITFQTAYLKAHYPAEYLSALLTSVKTNLDKAAIYLAECRTMGIEVHVPDVNRSVSDFAPITEVGADGSEVRSIVFGLSAVRNVGEGIRSEERGVGKGGVCRCGSRWWGYN